MRKYKVMCLTFSAQRMDGSRATIDKQEFCSCKSRGAAELIKRLLLDNSNPQYCLDNRAVCRPNEQMRCLIVEQ